MRQLSPLRRIRRLPNSELFRSSLSAFFLRGLGAVSTFIMSLIIARSLPVSQSGLFLLALTVTNILATVGLFGLNRSVLRFIGAYHAGSNWSMINAVVITVLRWAGVFLAFVSVSLFVGASWIADHVFQKTALAPVLASFAPGVFFLGLTMLLAHQLQAIRRTAQSIVILSIAIPLGVGLSLPLFSLETARDVALVYSAMAATAVVLGAIWWQGAHTAAAPGNFEPRVLWASCFPLWIVALMGLAIQWSGQLIAGAWVPAEEFAHLAVAQRTATLVSLILIAVNLVVAPRFAALHAQHKLIELQQLAIRATRLMTLFAVPVIVFICLFPGWIMGSFGDAYRAGAPLLVILALGQLVNVVTGSVSFLLSMTGHERDLRNVVLISGPLAIGAALILTPLFGSAGAAIATAFAVASQNLMAVYRVKKRLGFNTLAVWKRME